jgi:hypothetical protein
MVVRSSRYSALTILCQLAQHRVGMQSALSVLGSPDSQVAFPLFTASARMPFNSSSVAGPLPSRSAINAHFCSNS